MIYFHYCRIYREHVSHAAHTVIEKKLRSLSNYDTLKGVSSISSFVGAASVLRISRPDSRVILEERRYENNTLIVYYVRDFISMGNDHSWLQSYVELKNGRWGDYNPLPEEDEEAFLSSIQNNQTLSQNNQLIPLPERLKIWNQLKIDITYDIYETEEWLQFTMNMSEREGMRVSDVKMYGLLLSNIISEEAKSDVLKKEHDTSLLIARLNDYGICYYRIRANALKVV